MLSQYIERPPQDGGAGISTVQVSLIRPVSEVVRPPRALWVPFPFGRPFGPPNRPDIQLDVLKETLRLVEQSSAPALIDYPDTTEKTISHEDEWSCPVTFPGILPETESDALKTQLHTEVQLLRPWFDEGLRTRGRTTVGITGKNAESIGEMLEIMASFARGVKITVPDGYRQPMPALLQYLAADIRAFYGEAATSKPGTILPDPEDLEQWFFLETVAGDVFYEVRERLLRADLLVLMAQGLDDNEIDNRLVLNLGSAANLTRETLNEPAITRELLQESAKAYQAGLIGRFTRSFVPTSMRDQRNERTKITPVP